MQKKDKREEESLPIAINPLMLEHIEKIDWFARCGSLFTLELSIPYSQVPDLKTAIRKCSSQRWENATLEARNLLTEYLFLHAKKEFNACWNILAKSTSDFQDAQIVPQLQAAFDGKLPKKCLDSVLWDIHSAIMEDAYSCLNHPFRFFAELLRVYEEGHFPCGWTGGEYPKGTLLIY
jgi:hypothetical protein